MRQYPYEAWSHEHWLPKSTTSKYLFSIYVCLCLPMHRAPKCVLSIRWNLGRTHVWFVDYVLLTRYRTNWMQSIRIGHWWCNMDKFRLAPMATGVVFGDRMDNCILLFIKRHQKCWQSGLLHCTFPICYVDGTSGKASHRAYCRQPKLDPKRFQCVFCRYVV